MVSWLVSKECACRHSENKYKKETSLGKIRLELSHIERQRRDWL